MKLEANKENNIAKIAIELTSDEVKPYFEKMIAKKIESIEEDGFRKGKMPKAMFMKKYGEASVFSDVIDEILGDNYSKVVVENELNVIAPPNFDWANMKISTEEGFTVSGTVDLMPVVSVEGYADIKNNVEKEEATLSQEDVDNEIKSLLTQKAVVEITEEPAKMGDTVVIDFDGYVDGEQFEGGKGESYPLELGSNSFIPGFEEQLVGKKATENLDVKVTFPEDYHAASLAGKEATFKTTVHEVKVKNFPELTDEIAKEIEKYEAETTEELTKEIREKLLIQKQEQLVNKYNSDIMTKLIESANFEVPQSMVDQETNQQIEKFKEQLKSQGMEFEMYMQMMGGDESTLRNQIDPESKRRIQEMLVIEAVVKNENFEISEEEVDAKIAELVEQTKMTNEEVMNALGGDKNRLKENMAFDKAYKLVLGE